MGESPISPHSVVFVCGPASIVVIGKDRREPLHTHTANCVQTKIKNIRRTCRQGRGEGGATADLRGSGVADRKAKALRIQAPPANGTHGRRETKDRPNVVNYVATLPMPARRDTGRRQNAEACNRKVQQETAEMMRRETLPATPLDADGREVGRNQWANHLRGRSAWDNTTTYNDRCDETSLRSTASIRRVIGLRAVFGFRPGRYSGEIKFVILRLVAQVKAMGSMLFGRTNRHQPGVPHDRLEQNP